MSRYGFRFRRALLAIPPTLFGLIGLAFSKPGNSQYLPLVMEDF